MLVTWTLRHPIICREISRYASEFLTVPFNEKPVQRVCHNYYRRFIYLSSRLVTVAFNFLREIFLPDNACSINLCSMDKFDLLHYDAIRYDNKARSCSAAFLLLSLNHAHSLLFCYLQCTDCFLNFQVSS